MVSAVGLDLGSNSFSVTKLTRENQAIQIALDASYPVRLSDGMRGESTLDPAAVRRGLAALKRIAEEFSLRSVPFRAVSTAVLRLATNKEIFTRPAREILGAEVEVISGQEEARLAGKGSRLGIECNGPAITADIGGQSTELARDGASALSEVQSLPLGALLLTERFFHTDPPALQDVERLRLYVAKILRAAIPRTWSGELIAVAGTATTLGAIDLGLIDWQFNKVHGLKMRREQLLTWLKRMLSVSADDRINKHNIAKGRADIFPAGLIVLDELLDHLHINTFTISALGLRVGVALELLEDEP